MNTNLSPKDFFLHLGATIALYVAAGSFITLAFSIINYWRPDPLAGDFSGGSIAWPMALLIIVVPALYVLEWLINRDIRLMPEKKNLWIRRWRIFLTLFLAVILMGGDLVSLLRTYFSGEISSRFVFKVIAIILVAGAVWKYYFFSLYENFKRAALVRRFNAWFGIILVLATIVSGFVIVGSPAKQRSLRLDSQRVSDLMNIQGQIVDTYQRTQSLPANLELLNDPIRNFIVPKDPQTQMPYGYTVKTTGVSQTFELCADFALPSPDTKGRGEYGKGGLAYPTMIDTSYPYPGDYGESWKHEAGRTCFERTVNPDKYPPYPKDRVAY